MFQHSIDHLFEGNSDLALKMSFPNYDAFQGQQHSEDPASSGATGAQNQQNPMTQAPGSSPAPFQGGNGGQSGSAGGDQQGGDSKTTLWYDYFIFIQNTISILSATSSSLPSGGYLLTLLFF